MVKNTLFNRKAYLDILEKRVSALKEGYRQNIAIIGDELVGKSSIIFKFLNGFCDNRIVILYLEIHSESLDSFAKRFIASLLYNFLINSGTPLKEDLDFLIKKSRKYIPKTIEKVDYILCVLKKMKRNSVFGDLLSLCESINQETGKYCVIIMDEFQNLEHLEIKNLYREWSKLLISQKNTMYIIISSAKFKTKTILTKHLSLLFGNFELINIEPFDIKTTEEYLDLRLGESKPDKGLKDFISHFTGGYPFHLDLITDSISKSPHANLADILENLLFEPTGMLNQRFSDYLKRFLDRLNHHDYLNLLYQISSGHNKIKDLAHILHRQKKELLFRASHLLELDIISRSGDFLKINDRVFGFWLKFVYQEKSRSLTFDAKNQRVFFKENIENMIREFMLQTNKPIVERTQELLRLFENEVTQIERKKIRLTHFREVKPLDFSNKRLKQGLIGRSSDNLWILAFKDNLLTEEDIVEFAAECKKYRHKSQRKIIVVMQDIETNARLRAMEEKIWTWDISSLNQILDLFYKPQVII